jgi:hypothetical protein
VVGCPVMTWPTPYHPTMPRRSMALVSRFVNICSSPDALGFREKYRRRSGRHANRDHTTLYPPTRGQTLRLAACNDSKSVGDRLLSRKQFRLELHGSARLRLSVGSRLSHLGPMLKLNCRLHPDCRVVTGMTQSEQSIPSGPQLLHRSVTVPRNETSRGGIYNQLDGPVCNNPDGWPAS